MPRLEWTDNYAVSDVSNERRQPLGINYINRKQTRLKLEERSQLAFLTPPFLGGISAEVSEISGHNSDFL
jgi:hypothetical protein